MSHTYTPNPANHPTAITLPDDGEMKSAAVPNAAWAALADMIGQVARTVTFIDIPNLTFGGLIYADGIGLYLYTASTPFTPDGVLVITSVAMGGQWISQHVVLANLGKIAMVGPVPGGIYTANPGRIKDSVVPYGHYVTNFIVPGTNTTLDTTPITPSAGAAALTITVGTLAINDIVDCRLPMIGFNAGGDFSVGSYISFDDGATWSAVSPNVGGGPITYQMTSSGTGRAVSVDFVKAVTAAGVCKVQFRFNRLSAGTTNVWWGAGRIRTERP